MPLRTARFLLCLVGFEVGLNKGCANELLNSVMKTIPLLVALSVGFLAPSVHGRTVESVITNNLFEPHSVAVDADNNFYVTDSSNHRLVKYIPASGQMTNFAGLVAHPGVSDGTNYLARFNGPRGMVYDPVRKGLVVADTGNNLIRLVSLNGVVTTLAGDGVPGYIDQPGKSARFNYPVGLAVDQAGNVYVADTKNDAIRKLDINNAVTTVANGFYEPQGVAVSADGKQIFVADSVNQAIRRLQTDGVSVLSNTLIAGSDVRSSGILDSIIGTEALFNNPLALLWLGDQLGLLVSDSGNRVLRRVYHNPDLAGIPGAEFSVETFAGLANQIGWVDGPADKAKFGVPLGLALDRNGGYPVVDVANNALRRIQNTTVILAAITDPVIGWVDFEKDEFGERVTKLRSITQSVFNNDVVIAILGEPGTETFYTYGTTPMGADIIPEPDATTGATPPAYEDGLPDTEVPPSITDSIPDLSDVTMKVMSTADGRKPSRTVTARFKFQAANPVIVGNNPNSFVLQNRTTGAAMYYTTDGTEPTTSSFGPVFDGETVSITMKTSDVTFKVKAFKAKYRESSMQQKVFHAGDIVYNTISFGFDAGEASSDFLGAPGQRFYAPVTLSLLSSTKIYSLQFNLNVTNQLPAPVIPPGAGVIGFDSMLMKPIPGITPPVYTTIDPQMLGYYQDEVVTTNYSVVTNITMSIIPTNGYLTSVVAFPALTNLMVTNIVYYESYVSQGLPATIVQVTVNSFPVLNVSPNPVFPDQYYTNYTYTTVTTTTTTNMLVPTAMAFTNIYSTNVYISQLVTNQIFSSFNLTNFTTNYTYSVEKLTNANLVFDYLDLKETNLLARLLAVGWLERAGKTNLYDTTKQDLITYSLAHDRLYLSSGSRVILGAYSFNIPANAQPGHHYQIRIGRPSATADGISQDVFLDAPTNGSMGAGPINAVKNVTVGSTNYLVGDVSPFRWFNAGDFGDANLLNNDVLQVFQSAVYRQNSPPRGSDFFDAMDASNGKNNSFPYADGNDAQINNVKFGDGELNVDDVYVTFRRSLDPTLVNWVRYWPFPSTGQRAAYPTNNLFRGNPNLPAQRASYSQADLPVEALSIMASTNPPSVRFVAGDIQGAPGQTIDVPIQAEIAGPCPIRVLMLNLDVTSLDGAPPLTEPLTFAPAAGLGQPTFTASSGPANYAAVWLDQHAIGVWGTNIVGTLRLTLPSGVSTGAAYAVGFTHVSASPNGLSLLPQQVQKGLITFGNRSISSVGDAISDAWRLRFFGSVSNRLAQAMADADGDGVPNWAEYKAGTDPTNAGSLLRLISARLLRSFNASSLPTLVVRWTSEAGKNYILEVSSLANPQWLPISEIIPGTGFEIERTTIPIDGTGSFIRIRLVE
jgi:sugar lactone lactonase YvrE